MPQNRRVSMYTTNNKFGTFLDSDSQFIVPRFQRDYNWETDHVLEFWDDLYKHYNEWINKINRVPYYFGSFMLVNNDESDPKYIVVDGQQRLTTSMIFLIALRDYFVELDKNDDVDDLNELLHFVDVDGTQKPKLQLNRYNRNYFQTKLMQQVPLSQKVLDISRDLRIKNKQLFNTYKIFSKIIVDDDDSVFAGVTVDEKIDIVRDVYELLIINFSAKA